MKLIILIFYICVALFPSIIYCNDPLTEHLKTVEAIAESGGIINDIFRPLKEGLKGSGSYGFVYRGILLPINKEIVVKFTPLAEKKAADEEYEMFSYLHAINNPEVEKCGIPAVYYYGEWEQLIMMGFSILENDLDKLVDSKQFFESDVNVLLVLRDFILTSKFMHSFGVRHDDIKLANMLVRRSRTFLIDFNLSNRMAFKSHGGTFIYMPRRAHLDGTLYPKDDWESFLYSICHRCLGVDFDWIKKDPVEKVVLKDKMKQLARVLKRKENTKKTIKQMEEIQSETLRNIFIQLAEHIFDDGAKCTDKSTVFCGDDKKKFPDYDHWYRLVNDEIEKFDSPKPILFSWLTNEQRKSIIDLGEHLPPNITKIDDPSKKDFITMPYPDVKRKYFADAYKYWNVSTLPIHALSLSPDGARRKEATEHSYNIPSANELKRQEIDIPC